MSTAITSAELLAQGYSKAHCAYVEQQEAQPAPQPSGPDVRAWAREHEVVCPARGRIPAAVLEAFLEAGGR